MKTPWAIAVLVGLGGFAGTLARYGLGMASQHLSVGWPLGTLVSNVLGCFVIGIVTGLSARNGTISPEVRLVLATGFCGGFTTLSALMDETAAMLRASEYGHATLYIAGSLVVSMSACILGLMAARALTQSGGGIGS
jgi:CrcB protein